MTRTYTCPRCGQDSDCQDGYPDYNEYACGHCGVFFVVWIEHTADGEPYEVTDIVEEAA